MTSRIRPTGFLAFAGFVVAIVGGISIPIAIQRGQIAVKLIDVSIEILKSPPQGDYKEIRRWAIDVVNEYSAVDLPDILLMYVLPLLPPNEVVDSPDDGQVAATDRSLVVLQAGGTAVLPGGVLARVTFAERRSIPIATVALTLPSGEVVNLRATASSSAAMEYEDVLTKVGYRLVVKAIEADQERVVLSAYRLAGDSPDSPVPP